ncbi:MAG: succinylglutamate desuccinylase/aspartoacylase family protein [Bacillota bacterium]|nr:succinylglutamate desuccinylase/aspartoacylase family protein [Bacillota bacterium]
MGMLTVAGVAARPGEVARGVMPVGSFADGTPLEIPFILVNGAGDGPTVYVEAACHGSEINGLEVIRRLVTEELDPAKLKGRFILVPVANVVAFTHRQGHTPFDNENMNRVWPGKAQGRMSERMAYALWENAIKQANYLIDLHTGNSTLVTHVVFMGGEQSSRELAEVFGVEVLLQEEKDPDWQGSRFAGKLRNSADGAGIPAICPELGGNSKFEKVRIEQGLRGVLNVAKHLGMIPGSPVLPKKQWVVSQGHLTQVKVACGGAALFEVTGGDMVRTGDLICRVYSIRDFAVLEEVRAPMDGMIIMVAENPVLHTGDMAAMMGKVTGQVDHQS